MKTRTTDVYSLLRQRVATGELTGGTRISELGLSKELGVSRAPVREAVMRMTGEGLLDYVPTAGTFVKEMTPQDLSQVYQLRQWIEAEAAAEAAEQITQHELQQLQSCCDQMEDLSAAAGGAEMVGRIAVADLSFHLTLVKASHNLRAARLIADQHLLSSLIGRAEGSWSSAAVRQNHQEHQAILNAVRDGDANTARQGMRDHLAFALKDALKNFDTSIDRITPADTLGVVVEDLTETLRDIETHNHDDT